MARNDIIPSSGSKDLIRQRADRRQAYNEFMRFRASRGLRFPPHICSTSFLKSWLAILMLQAASRLAHWRREGQNIRAQILNTGEHVHTYHTYHILMWINYIRLHSIQCSKYILVNQTALWGTMQSEVELFIVAKQHQILSCLENFTCCESIVCEHVWLYICIIPKFFVLWAYSF